MSHPEQKRQCGEECWVLLGGVDRQLWWARRRWRTSQDNPVAVAFSAERAMRREEERGDVVGFFHTHPNMAAVPSGRDLATMRQWCTALGRQLICVIRGSEGARGWVFLDDESQPFEVQVKELLGAMVVGTTAETGIGFEILEEDEPPTEVSIGTEHC